MDHVHRCFKAYIYMYKTIQLRCQAPLVEKTLRYSSIVKSFFWINMTDEIHQNWPKIFDMKYLRPHLGSLLITPSVKVAINHMVYQYETLLNSLELFSQYWFEQIRVREQSGVFFFLSIFNNFNCFKCSEDHRICLVPRC